MAIWMDMTQSMWNWKGGVVGIVRAELEIAKNLHNEYPDVRFSMFNGQDFVEIPKESLEWLWNADSVGDAYMEAMGRNGNKSSASWIDRMPNNNIPQLQQAYRVGESRLHRLKLGVYLYVDSLPKGIRPFIFSFAKVLGVIATGISKLRLFFLGKKQNSKKLEAELISKKVISSVKYPYVNNDVVFSCGWLDSGKEPFFTEVKNQINLYLIYTIYDTILINPSTTQLYDSIHVKNFRSYIIWMAQNADYLIYGGKTAQIDTDKYYESIGIKPLPGKPVKWGSDITKVKISKKDSKDTLEKLGIKKPYILLVGSIEPRKNYDTIYKAYKLICSEQLTDVLPQIVIVGRPAGGSLDIVNTIEEDLNTKNTFVILSPTDEELNILYSNCEFTMLPSLYEGWSLTLPESLCYGKFCLCSDVGPLREIGDGLVDFVEPLNPRDWAEKIAYYINNPDEVAKYEEIIKENWKNPTWNQCSQNIYNYIKDLPTTLVQQKRKQLFFDISTTWHCVRNEASITGILRTELTLAKYFGIHFPTTRFFVLTSENGYIEITYTTLSPLLDNDNLDIGYRGLMYNFKNLNPPVLYQSNTLNEKQRKRKNSYWLVVSVLPNMFQKIFILKKEDQISAIEKNSPLSPYDKEMNFDYQLPFHKGDIVFSPGSGQENNVMDTLRNCKPLIKFYHVQLLYDFTPILYPEVHRKDTQAYFKRFFEYVSFTSDVILYGGATAMKDGQMLEEELRYPIPKGYPIKFGNDIIQRKLVSPAEEMDILNKLGITKSYVMAVGTMEARKNYETLYKAYLEMMNKYPDSELPQLIFVGHPGWRVDDFLAIFNRDKRIENRVLQISPTDKELDILYRHCDFTVLASLYEGWSLTLPESLGYNKFCICSDVAPLREIGQDMLEYVHPFDVSGWADSIMHYYTHPDELKRKQEFIKKHWTNITWDDCAKNIAHILNTDPIINN